MLSHSSGRWLLRDSGHLAQFTHRFVVRHHLVRVEDPRTVWSNQITRIRWIQPLRARRGEIQPAPLRKTTYSVCRTGCPARYSRIWIPEIPRHRSACFQPLDPTSRPAFRSPCTFPGFVTIGGAVSTPVAVCFPRTWHSQPLLTRALPCLAIHGIRLAGSKSPTATKHDAVILTCQAPASLNLTATERLAMAFTFRQSKIRT